VRISLGREAFNSAFHSVRRGARVPMDWASCSSMTSLNESPRSRARKAKRVRVLALRRR
jgi:hypothetical protein